MNKSKNSLSHRCVLFLTIALFGAAVTFHIHCKKSTTPENNTTADKAFNLNAPPKETLLIAGQSFTVELAYTRIARQQGLMFRQTLEPRSGMLFIFYKSKIQSFHMNHCLIDLDILFLDESGKIVHSATMTAPPPGKSSKIYSSKVPIKYALELPVGTIGKLDLKIGRSILLSKRIKSILPEPD